MKGDYSYVIHIIFYISLFISMIFILYYFFPLYSIYIIFFIYIFFFCESISSRINPHNILILNLNNFLT